MIQRRAGAAGIKTRIGNYTFRAAGITAYPENSGKLENRAAHRQPRVAADDEALRPAPGRDFSRRSGKNII
jgi:hypothetical protein